jgi:hypothetical protein
MRKKKGNPRGKSSKEHKISFSQVTKCLRWIWDLERLWSFELCLGVNARALVMNVILRNLGCLELWWLGVFIALNHQINRWGGCWRWAHRTGPVHCSVSRHITQPLGFGARSIVGGFVLLQHRTIRCHTGQSGALSTHCSDFCCGTMLHCSSVRVGRCPLAHRTVRWIIVEHARVFPRVTGWTLYGPGAPNTVRCARPQHTQVLFAPFELGP